MAGSSRYTRAISANVGEIERRLRQLEQNLESIGARASTNAKASADSLGDVIASSLAEWADRFRKSAGSVTDQSAAIGKDAARYGDLALRRISHETEHQPLLALGIALGVGILIGLVSHRR